MTTSRSQQQPASLARVPSPLGGAGKPVKALLVLSCVAAAAAVGLSEAETSPYYLGVSQSLSHESNMLRLNEGVAAPAGYSRSDTLSATSLLAGFDQPISRQRLFGDLALRMNRYSSNDAFNGETYNAKLGVDWETINRLSGTLALSAGRGLSNFNLQEIGLLRNKNFEDSMALDFSVRKGVVTEYSLYATLGHQKVENSVDTPAVQARNYQQTSGSVGVTWAPSDLLSFNAGLRLTDGRYPRFGYTNGAYFSDSFKRQNIELSSTWNPSGRSSLTANVAIGKTDYDLANQRDYDGVTGSIRWVWQPTGKLRLNTSLSRETGQDSYAVSLFNPFSPTPTTGIADFSRLNTALRVTADWAATSKVSVSASASLADRAVVRTLPALLSTFTTDSGNERVQSVSLNARWAATRAIQVGCGVSTDRIKGSGALAATNIKSNGVNCYGQFMLK